jgi:hypothetical protein
VLSASRGIEQQHTFLDPPSTALDIEELALDVVNGPLVRRVMGFIDEATERLAP